MNYSYLMGVKDITELKNNGFIVEEIDGNYGIKFEKDKAKFYEEFIIKNLEMKKEHNLVQPSGKI